MTAKTLPDTRDHYAHRSSITTRWGDNDIYGHVNNVQYYSFFDTVVNRYLIGAGALDIHGGAVIGLVVETATSRRWHFRRTWKPACGWPTWAAAACVTRWRCSPPASRALRRWGTSCMCMSIGRRAGRCRCLARCWPHWRRCAPPPQPDPADLRAGRSAAVPRIAPAFQPTQQHPEIPCALAA